MRHYHADNGCFQDNAWKKGCKVKSQGISYCGVGAHWQNGRAEKRIRDLNDVANIMLNYAMQKWPQVITTNLNNCIPQVGKEQSSIEIFRAPKCALTFTIIILSDAQSTCSIEIYKVERKPERNGLTVPALE